MHPAPPPGARKGRDGGDGGERRRGRGGRERWGDGGQSAHVSSGDCPRESRKSPPSCPWPSARSPGELSKEEKFGLSIVGRQLVAGVGAGREVLGVQPRRFPRECWPGYESKALLIDKLRTRDGSLLTRSFAIFFLLVISDSKTNKKQIKKLKFKISTVPFGSVHSCRNQAKCTRQQL